MNKLKMQSCDVVGGNVEKIAALFPQCVTERNNLRKVCDEILGSQNFVAQLIWERAYSSKNDARFISNSHDYVVMYCRNINDFIIGRLPRTEETNSRYTNPDINDDSIVLYFFSGSGLMGHAVMKYNAEKSKHCNFILVQLPEETDDKVKKAGYENICQIGEERIRCAGNKVKEEVVQSAKGLDTGFRVLKLDSSNMEDVFYTPDKFEPSLLDSLVDNIKPDRSLDNFDQIIALYSNEKKITTHIL